MNAYFDRFTLSISRIDALGASHQGPCDADIAALLKKPSIRRQFAKIDPAAIAAELRECGAWTDATSEEENRARILWIACGSIREWINNGR